jgi:hypothetical protein
MRLQHMHKIQGQLASPYTALLQAPQARKMTLDYIPHCYLYDQIKKFKK